MTSGRARTRVYELAEWVVSRRGEHLSHDAGMRLKLSVLDSIGCGIGALDAPPIRALSGYLAEVGGAPTATLIGGGRSSADRAALFNGALIRYLDFNDTFAAKGESCHPSDNMAPVLAAAEQADASGRDFLIALAIAYQVQCRLGEVAPVRSRGFDHTVLGMLGMAAGAARVRGLTPMQAANAIAITGTAFNALRVTRTGRLSNWKGLAAPNAAFGATHAVALAAHGITGPDQMFEGNKGLMDSISGPFALDWAEEGLDRILRCSIKKYNAEYHSQSAVEAALRLRRQPGFDAALIDVVEVDTFATGFHIIGGGEEGDKKHPISREDADHSLPYIVAVALLDGEVTPAQYTPGRIASQDVRELLERVEVRLGEGFSDRFPDSMPVALAVHYRDGRSERIELDSYHGFYAQPFAWSDAVAKFETLTVGRLSAALRKDIIAAVQDLDEIATRDLTGLLARVPTPTG